MNGVEEIGERHFRLPHKPFGSGRRGIFLAGIIFIGMVLFSCGPQNPDFMSEKKKGKLPDVEFQTLSGEKVTSEQLKGKVVIVDFWASWCEPCKKEIPHFQKMYEQWKDQGFFVVGIAVRDQPDKVRAFRDKHQVTYPITMNNQQLYESFTDEIGPIKGLPTSLIVDREGNIRQKITGYRQPDYFERRIQSYLQ